MNTLEIVALLLILSAGFAYANHYLLGLPRGIGRLIWSGLRGGVSVALVLSLPESPFRGALVTACYAIVIFRMIAQGLTLGQVAAWLYAPGKEQRADRRRRDCQGRAPSARRRVIAGWRRDHPLLLRDRLAFRIVPGIMAGSLRQASRDSGRAPQLQWPGAQIQPSGRLCQPPGLQTARGCGGIAKSPGIQL